jgi:hypothetical protein
MLLYINDLNKRMGFESDLLASVRNIFLYTELVMSRGNPNLGELYDIRIANMIRYSDAAHQAIRALFSHFEKGFDDLSLKYSLQHADKVATYMLQSFKGAMLYKKPYSAANPFGISIDVSKLTQNRQNFEAGVINAARMAAMGMLFVHHWLLQYTLFMVALANKDGYRMIDDEGRRKYRDLMIELNAFMMVPTNATGLGEALNFTVLINDDAFGIDGAGAAHNTDLVWTQYNAGGIPALTTEQSSLVGRKLYLSAILKILHYATTDANNAADLAYLRFTDQYVFHKIKLDYLMVFPTRRIFEDQNYRETLLQQSLCNSNNPVYEYATLPYTEGAVPQQFVIQQGPGQVNVQPRVRVRMWRRPMTWIANTWSEFALIHGEAGMFMDMMYNIVPVLIGNRRFLRNDTYPIESLHMLFTRIRGPDDKTTLFGATQANIDATRAVLDTLPVPNAPFAVNIQPMPSSIRQWYLAVNRNFGIAAAAPPAARLNEHWYLPSHAVFHRCTSVNVNDTLRKANVNPEHMNVVWHQTTQGQAEWARESYCMFNSIFFIHYGNALSALETPLTANDQKVFNSQNLDITGALYNGCHGDGAAAAAAGAAFAYEPCVRYQDWIRKQLVKFKENFATRGAGFLHPRSWITDAEANPAGPPVAGNPPNWAAYDEAAFDVNTGTVLVIPPAAAAAAAAAAAGGPPPPVPNAEEQAVMDLMDDHPL